MSPQWESPEQRFLAKIKVMENGCHEWQSTMRRDGYGKMWLDGETVQAHRAAWRIFKGEIPADRHVLHNCDNRRCVNLDHLRLGTPAENVRDKIERFPGLWGKMKYGPETCAKIRRLRGSGLSQQAIADAIGMHQTTVSNILRGVTINSRKELAL